MNAPTSLETLLGQLLSVDHVSAPSLPPAAPAARPTEKSEHAPMESTGGLPMDSITGLGPNQRHAAALEAAGRRTGIPAAALASIVDAEAARLPDGGWNPHSRNPRSSAAGLGQFLSGTWMDMARRSGTALHELASRRGLIDQTGRIMPGARPALLAMRHDPNVSINAIADYAKTNLDHLRARGVDVGADPQSIARAAYIAHHLGPGDAVRYYQGTIPPHRARTLLAAQIGQSDAGKRISAAGDAALAHRQWLGAYVSRNIRTVQYTRAAESVNL